MKKNILKKLIKETIKEQLGSGVPPYTHSQASPQYPGDPDGPFPGNWNDFSWQMSWVGTDPNNFASSSNHCNFLVGRYNLWSNQINNVGPLQANQLHAKLRILHRAYAGVGC